MIAANYRVNKRATRLREEHVTLSSKINRTRILVKVFIALRNQSFFLIFHPPSEICPKRKSLDPTRGETRYEFLTTIGLTKKRGGGNYESKRFKRAMKLDAPHESVSTHMPEIDKAICLMQFDARVDAFVPRDSEIESMRYDFFLDRERERRGGEKKSKRFRNQRSRSNGRALSMMSTKVSERRATAFLIAKQLHGTRFSFSPTVGFRRVSIWLVNSVDGKCAIFFFLCALFFTFNPCILFFFLFF